MDETDILLSSALSSFLEIMSNGMTDLLLMAEEVLFIGEISNTIFSYSARLSLMCERVTEY